MKKSSSQSGYTLIESIGFIAVITMVAISIISVVSHMLDRYRNSRLTSQIVELQKNINARFAAVGNYEKLKLSLLKNEKLAPADMNWSGNTLYHKYSGKVTVGLYSSTITKQKLANADSYYIQFADVPKNACIELAIQNWAHDRTSNLVAMIINSKWSYWRVYQGAAYKKYIMPLSRTLALELCSKEKNTIKWAFM